MTKWWISKVPQPYHGVQCHPERSEPASEVEGSAPRGVERFGSRILRKLSRCEPANSRDNCHPERRIRSFKCSGCASARRKLRMTFSLCRTRTLRDAVLKLIESTDLSGVEVEPR